VLAHFHDPSHIFGTNLLVMVAVVQQVSSMMLSLLMTVAATASAHPRVGDSWGTNIHFLAEAAPGEAAQIAAAFKVARMDLQWAAVEKVKGVYDFGAYDGLLKVSGGLLDRYDRISSMTSQ
jgi:hypothetical protein